MREFGQFLFKIDKLVFDRKEVQYFLLGLFATILLGHLIGLIPTGRLTTWVEVGLGVYVVLFIYRFATTDNQMDKLQKDYEVYGIFPFVKGFTYACLLGPIGLLLAIFLAMLPSHKREKPPQDEE